MSNKPDPFVSRNYGDGEAWTELVNSEHWDGFGNFTDMLDDPAWVTSYMRFWKFRIPVHQPLPQNQFRALRLLIRGLLEKAAAGKKLHIEQLKPLNDWMTIAVNAELEEDQNGLRLGLRAVQFDWNSILTYISYSFAQSIVDEGQGRLKICNNPDCRWVFIDKTKGNVRRWCNDATCGNRERVRKARAARKRSS
jgi:predicted RNA-binding Zn ribbon-like protein